MPDIIMEEFRPTARSSTGSYRRTVSFTKHKVLINVYELLPVRSAWDETSFTRWKRLIAL